MKKKWLSVTIASAVLVLGTGVYTTLASNPGYEAYKEALIETHKLKSGVTNMEMMISDGNKVLEEVSVQTMYNLNEQRGLANVHLKTADQDVELQMQNEGKQIYINNGDMDTLFALKKAGSSEEKNITPEEAKKIFESHHNKELMKVAELVVDTLTKPLHDQFVAGPDNTISVDITDEDIPAAIKAMGTYMVKNGLKHHANIELTTAEYPFLTSNYQQQYPQLIEDITFDQIKVDAQLTEAGALKQQQATFKISGKDQNGQQQTLIFQINFSLENINDTTVPAINLEGKTIETIEMKDVHNFHS